MKSKSERERVLINAILHNDLACIKTLLKDKSLVNTCDENGTSVLHIAVEYEYFDIVKCFCGIPCLNIEARTQNGDTALHYAAKSGNYDIAEQLCRYHADKKALNNLKQTPHGLALKSHRNTKLVTLLKYEYADFAPYCTPKFHRFILESDLHKASKLLEQGLPINKIDSNGKTALHYIADKDALTLADLESAQWLIDKGININLAEYVYNDSALHIACDRVHYELAKILFHAGAECHTENINGFTPRGIASLNKNLNLFLLLNNERNIKQPINKIDIHLLLAVKNNDIRNIERYIREGANINYVNDDGNSALKEATQKNYEKIVRILISAGANTNIIDKIGNTPLHIASYHGYSLIASILLQAGADPKAVNHKGFSPLYMASINNKSKIEHLLSAFINENCSDKACSNINEAESTIPSTINRKKSDNMPTQDAGADSIEQRQRQYDGIFDFSIDSVGNIRINKYYNSIERSIIKIPDFVYGFTLNEAPSAAIFEDLSGIELIELGAGLRDLSYMFYRSGNAHLDLSLWDVSTIINMSGMFCDSQISHVGNLEKWNVSSVRDFSWLFYKSRLTDIGKLNLWTMSQAKNLSGMFTSSQLTHVGDLSKWDISQAQDISWLFADTLITDLGDLSGWNVSSVTDMQSLFEASQLEDVGDISKWDVSQVLKIRNLFSNVKLRKDYYPILWSPQIRAISQTEMFHLKKGHIFDFTVDKEGKIRIEKYYDNENRTKIEIPDFVHGFSCRKSYSVEKEIPLIKRYPIFDDLTHLKLISLHSRLKDLSFMFYRSGAGEIDLSGWDVSKITSMESLFEKSSLSSIGKLDSWEVDQVVNMANLFASSTFTDVGDLSEWDITSVTNMSGLFKNSQIKNAGYLGEWDITSWVTSKSGALENTKLENVGELKQHWECFGDSEVNYNYDDSLYDTSVSAALSNPPPPTQVLAKQYSELKALAQHGDDSLYLLTACEQNSLDMVIWLLEKGATINYDEALTLAKKNSDERIAPFLQHVASTCQLSAEDHAFTHDADISDLPSKRKVRSDKGQIHSLRPHFKICIHHGSSNCTIFIDIPKQKFERSDENRKICAILTSELSTEKNVQLEMYESDDFYYSKEVKDQIKINSVFDNYKLTLNDECRYFLKSQPFFMFREDDKGNLIQIFKPTFSQGFYVLTDNTELKTNGVCIEENTLTNRENQELALRLFWVEPKIGDYFTINNIRYSLNDNLRATPEFTFPDKCTIHDHQGKPICASTKHPNIEIILPKAESDKSFILCNETKLPLEESDAIQFDELGIESENRLVKVNLERIVPSEAKLYKLQIIGSQEEQYLNINYILLPLFTCDGISELYYDESEANVQLLSDFPLKTLDEDIKVQNEHNRSVLRIPLSAAQTHRDFCFKVENQQYTLRLKLHLLTLKYHREDVHYSTKKDIWYRDLQSQLRVNIPPSNKVSLYLESNGIGKGKQIQRVRGRKRLLDFQMDKINQMMEESNKSDDYLVIKAQQGDSQVEYKYRILRKLWFHEFSLYSDNKQMFIRSKFDGKAECMVKFYHRNSDECIYSASIESGKDSQIAGICGSDLYDDEGNCRYDISISQKYKKGLSSKEEEIHSRYTPKINAKAIFIDKQ